MLVDEPFLMIDNNRWILIMWFVVASLRVASYRLINKRLPQVEDVANGGTKQKVDILLS
jgi:hypothetical protein